MYLLLTLLTPKPKGPFSFNFFTYISVTDAGGVDTVGPQRLSNGDDQEGVHAASPRVQVRQSEGDSVAVVKRSTRRRRGKERGHATARCCPLRPSERGSSLA